MATKSQHTKEPYACIDLQPITNTLKLTNLDESISSSPAPVTIIAPAPPDAEARTSSLAGMLLLRRGIVIPSAAALLWVVKPGWADKEEEGFILCMWCGWKWVM